MSKRHFSGYDFASTIDAAIVRRLQKHPINATNALEWAHFSRTVRTTLDLIEGEIHKLLRAGEQSR